MPERRKFALIGASGYVAPRHMKAIRDVNGKLVAALDPHDSVGVIDSYYPDARFFVEFERFDRYIDKARRDGNGIDYLSVCSPNYLHDSHARFGLRSGADVICEKPLVLNPWNIDGLEDMERATGHKVYSILQLRLHPATIALKERISASTASGKHDVDLTYITPRGRWYQVSWKGEDHKSGGIATNIGIHFFDLLSFVFGAFQSSRVFVQDAYRASGFLELEKARVRWFLSIDASDISTVAGRTAGSYRSIQVDGSEFELSDGFEDLHTASYRHVLDGKGFGLDVARPIVQMVADIRNAVLHPLQGDYHPALQKYRRIAAK